MKEDMYEKIKIENGFKGNKEDFEKLFNTNPKFYGNWEHLFILTNTLLEKSEVSVNAWNSFVKNLQSNEKKHLKRVTLDGANLSKSDLRGLIFKNANLRNVDFSMIEADGVDFSSARIKNTIFSNASLCEAKFENLEIENCKFDSCKMQSTTFYSSKIDKCHFSESDLFQANFDSTRIYESNFDRSKISFANYSHANISTVSLKNSEGCRTKFFQAKLINSDATGAQLHHSDLSHVDLRRTTLTDVALTEANLSAADLRDVKGRFYLDDNVIKDTVFCPSARDPYSTMRRAYTGPKFFFIFFLSILSISPYVGKSIYWSTVGKLQLLMQSYDIPRSSSSNPQFNLLDDKNLRETTVIAIASGYEDGALAFSVTTLLFFYNVLRGFVTVRMADLRDTEERSRRTPRKSDYRYLYIIHLFLLGLSIVAVISFLINVANIMTMKILLPVNY